MSEDLIFSGEQTSIPSDKIRHTLFDRTYDKNKWLDISDDAYHGTTGISSTDIRQMAITPYHFYCHKLVGIRKEDTPAMRFGRLAHAALLEPNRFKEKYKMEPNVDKRTKEGRIAYTTWLNDLPRDAVIINDKDSELLLNMISRLWGHPKTPKIFGSPGLAESSGFWIDKATGLSCKTRIDFFTDDNILVELKTTDNASPKEFSRSIHNFGYHYQLAWNIRGYKEITGKDIVKSLFVVSEKKQPYDCAIYLANKEMIAIADLHINTLLERIKICYDMNSWEGYGDEIEEINLPEWAYKYE